MPYGHMPEEQNRTWTDRYMLRLPDGMRDKIKAAAEHNNRSMNAEIVLALEYWLETDLPYTLSLGERATAEEARSQGAKDRADRFEAVDISYADEIERSIKVLQQILRVMRASSKNEGIDD